VVAAAAACAAAEVLVDVAAIVVAMEAAVGTAAVINLAEAIGAGTAADAAASGPTEGAWGVDKKSSDVNPSFP
jgi:hypothetical protein